MLKGIDPLLGPEMLATLRAMGHGDELAIVDGNYPGQEHARRLLRADGHGLLPVLDAVLSVLPIDDFVADAIFHATVGGDGATLDPIHREMIACCQRHEPARRAVPLSGPTFYERVRHAHSVIQTSEPRLYGNIILRKGVVRPAR